MARKNPTAPASGIELVRRLTAEGDRIFTVDRAREIAPGVGISEAYLREALHYLAKAGWVVRLRKGLYAICSAIPGVTGVHEFEIAMALVAPAAISHASALSYHGLTDQVPRRVFVLTVAGTTIPHPRGRGAERQTGGYRAGGAVFRFVQTKPAWFFGTEKVWVGEARIPITDSERTLLDGLSMPQHCGDFAEVLHAFETRGRQLDLDRILDYAMRLDAATAKRLGWVLAHQGIPEDRLKRLAELPIKGYRTLDPTGPRRGPCDRRWMIQENLPGKVNR